MNIAVTTIRNYSRSIREEAEEREEPFPFPLCLGKAPWRT